MVSRRAVLAGLSGAPFAAQTVKAQVPTANTTVLFDTAASLNPSTQLWSLPLHAWTYAQQNSTVRKAAIAALFKRRYGLTVAPEHQALFDERINLLLADNKRGQTPIIALREHNQDIWSRALPRTGPNGHTRLEVNYGPDQPALRRTLTLAVAGPSSEASAQAHLIPPVGVSVISDIDDTVKASGVLDRQQLFQSTFFKPFQAVPGMADLLSRLAGADSGVHYVSSSPWHLYQPLRRWLAADGFPVASLHLKHIRLKDQTIFDIAKSPIETKPPVIATILKRYPQRLFILVGDSGEKDPEVYADTARAFPGQITRILIRRAPGDTSGTERFRRVFAGLPPAMAQVFDQPTEVQTGG